MAKLWEVAPPFAYARSPHTPTSHIGAASNIKGHFISPALYAAECLHTAVGCIIVWKKFLLAMTKYSQDAHLQDEAPWSRQAIII